MTMRSPSNSIMNRCVWSCLVLLWGSVLSGCTSVRAQYVVVIDSISATENLNRSYVLFSGESGVRESDLQFQEYASYVDGALGARGFVRAASIDEANTAIFLAYGVSDPETRQYAYSVPTWGQTGVSSSYTTGSISTYGNYGTFSGSTFHTPTYGVTGSTIATGSVTRYSRHMVLTALDLDAYRRTGEEQELWRTIVTSSGSSGDLRKVFPVLVGASAGYLATNTGEQVVVRLSENDPRVSEVRAAHDVRATAIRQEAAASPR